MNFLENTLTAERILNLAFHSLIVLFIGWLFAQLFRHKVAPLRSGISLMTMLILMLLPFLSISSPSLNLTSIETTLPFKVTLSSPKIEVQGRGLLAQTLDKGKPDVSVESGVGKGQETPVRTIGDFKSPKLITKVDPVYPEIARQAKVEGVVILEVTTDIYGQVQRVKVLRSIPLLDKAAIDAVKQWVYEPMVINGKPRGVIFTVSCPFRLEEKGNPQNIT